MTVPVQRLTSLLPTQHQPVHLVTLLVLTVLEVDLGRVLHAELQELTQLQSLEGRVAALTATYPLPAQLLTVPPAVQHAANAQPV